MKPRSLRRTFQEQNRFLFNQERQDFWPMALLRTDLPVGAGYAIEHPVENEQDPDWKVILPRSGSRVRHIHILGDSIPVFADGVISYPGQALALLVARNREELALLKSRVQVRLLSQPEQHTPGPASVTPQPDPVPDPALPLEPAGSGEPAGEPGAATAAVLSGAASPAAATPEPVSASTSLGGQPDQAPSVQQADLTAEAAAWARAQEEWARLMEDATGLWQHKTVACGDAASLFTSGNSIQHSTQHYAEFPLFLSEPRGATAEWRDDLLTINCSTSWPHLVRRCVSEATGLAQRHIKVVSQPAHLLPDRFLLDSTMMAVWAAMGAMSILGKTQLFFQAMEDQQWGTRTGLVDTVIQSAHDPDGRLLALRSCSTFNMGAWPCASEEIMQLGLLGLCSLYRCPNQIHHIRIVKSPEPPRFPPSLMGMNYTIQSMEQHVDQICRSYGFDRVTWRVQNLLRKGDACPYGTAAEQFVPPRLVLQSASIKSDFSRTHAALELQRGKYRVLRGSRDSLTALKGTGIALSFQTHGLLLSRELEYRARVGLELSDDGHLTIRAPMHAGNQGLREAWLAAVEESLGIEERNVSFVKFSSQDLEDTGPARFSRVASVFSPILATACTSLKKRIRSKKFPFAVMSTWARQKNMAWDEKAFAGTPFLGRSWAAAVVELSLNPVELAIQVRKVCIAIHAGAILHPHRAEAHVRQSLLSCLAWLSGSPENLVDGETFHVPHNSQPPQIIITFENQDDPLSPLQRLPHAGALGELVYGCVPAAWNNALYQITRSMPRSTPLSVTERSASFMPITEGDQA